MRSVKGVQRACPAPAAAARDFASAPTPAPIAPVAPVVEAPAATRPAATATTAVADEVLVQVTSIVAEMTGYPADLLEPDLDLEADLGVDTVKQAEVFAAVRGHYHLERDENLKLRDFPTLRHVAGWVRQRAGLGAAPARGGRDRTGARAPRYVRGIAAAPHRRPTPAGLPSTT